MSDISGSRGHRLGRPSNNKSDFNKFRETITRLWSVENHTLREVMEFMETQHKFSATPKQYKKHFKDWKLRKNIRTREMFQLARLKIEHDTVGKRPTFLLRGEEVDCGKIDRFIRRKRDELGSNSFKDLLHNTASISATPTTVCCISDANIGTAPSNSDRVHTDTADRLDPWVDPLTLGYSDPPGVGLAFVGGPATRNADRSFRSTDLDQHHQALSVSTSPDTRSSGSSCVSSSCVSPLYHNIELLQQSLVTKPELSDNYKSITREIDRLNEAFVSLDARDEQHDIELGNFQSLARSLLNEDAFGEVWPNTYDEEVAFYAPADKSWNDEFDSEFEATPFYFDSSRGYEVPQLVHDASAVEHFLKNGEPSINQQTNNSSPATALASRGDGINTTIMDVGVSTLLNTPEHVKPRLPDYHRPRKPRKLPTLRSRFIKMRELVETSKQLERFRSRFIHHYEMMKWAGEVSHTDFRSISELFSSHRQAWSIAILTMKKLCNLRRPDGLEEIMPFLCLARAIAEILDDNIYLKGFSNDLKLWKSLLNTPGDTVIFSEGVRLIWGVHIDMQCPEPDFLKPGFLDPEAEILLSLRDIAADSLLKANSLFFPTKPPGFRNQSADPREQSAANYSQRSTTNTGRASCSPPQTTASKEPPDKDVSSSIDNFMQIATHYWMIDSVIVQLVTGAIFPLVFHFLQTWTLGTEHIGETISLSGQKDMFPTVILSTTPQSAYSDFDPLDPCLGSPFFSPTLLSRPATPTLKPWYPTLGLGG